jgi:acetylornithine deacetylase/succinyl-diaminopimelate desuccinylase-like protein
MRPGLCTLYVDVRVPPNVSDRTVLAEFEQELSRALADADPVVDVFANATPGGWTPVDHPLVQSALSARAAELGPQSLPDRLLNNSDDGKVFALYGIPYVMCGPGSTGRVIGGKPYGKEWVEIAQLVAAARLYLRLALSVNAVNDTERDSWRNYGRPSP